MADFKMDTRRTHDAGTELKTAGEHLLNEVSPGAAGSGPDAGGKEISASYNNRKEPVTDKNPLQMDPPAGKPSDSAISLNPAADIVKGKDGDTPQFHMDSQGLTYRRTPEAVKDTAKRILETPAETLKGQTDFVSDNRTEEYSRTETKVKEIGTVISSVSNAARRSEIIEQLDRETSRYVAGDMFFRGGDMRGAVSEYVEAAKNVGVYEGYTVGVHKAFLDVCAHPEEYMVKGTLTIDENKVLDKIKASEKFKVDEAGAILLDKEGRPVYDVPQNAKWRKKAEKTFKYREINDLEIKMRSLTGRGVYTPGEEKLLSENNRIFTFTSVSDIERTARITDKYLLEQIKFVGSGDGDILRIGAAKLFGKDLKDVNLKMLGKMSSRDVRKLIKALDGKVASGAIIEALRAKEMLTASAEKIKRLGSIGSVIKTGGMFIGGDELMQSDFGQGVSYVRQGIRTGHAVIKTGTAAGKLTKKAAVKTADYIMPKQMDAYRQWRIEKAKAKASKIQRRVEAIQNLKPVKAVKGVKETVKSGMSAAGEAYKNTRLGKVTGTIKKYGSRIAGKIGAAIRKPFTLFSKALNFIKSKVLMPVIIVLGGLFIIMYLIAGFGGAGGGSAVSVLSTILSEEEQFADYQAKYDECDGVFQGQVAGIVNGFASTLNLKGRQIRYGINSMGLNDKGITTEAEYKNGITMNYFYDGSQTAGISSNIEDCLSAMAVIMQQTQAEHHAEALQLLEVLYKSTHSYTTIESALYPCSHGCEITHYNCNEWQLTYPSSELRFKPWLFSDVYVPDSSHECVVCMEDGIPYEQYAGCTVTGTCYHGENGNLGRSHAGCSNYTAVWDCDHSCDNEDCSHNCSDNPIGCAGYYECDGHDHYGCPDGHDIAACFGHVDLTMNVNIASLNRIFDMGGVEIKESTEGGEDDE